MYHDYYSHQKLLELERQAHLATQELNQATKRRSPMNRPILSKSGALLIAIGARLQGAQAATAQQKTLSRPATTH